MRRSGEKIYDKTPHTAREQLVRRFSILVLVVEDPALVFLQGKQQDHAEDTAGDKLSGAHRQAIIAETLQCRQAVDQQAIAVDQDQRDDKGIGCDRTDRSTPFPPAERVSPECAKQSRQAAEKNVRQCTACQNVA